MKIVFRVDASDKIGTGHVYRCLNLAAQYKDEHTIYFICKSHPYNLISQIEENYKTFQIHLHDYSHITLDMETWVGEKEICDAEKTIQIIRENNLEVDWLIVDHYAIQETWEKELIPFVKNIGVIDDFTNRPHYYKCNFILNQQITPQEGQLKYKDIIQKSNNQINIYCGNEYMLLHPNYFQCNHLEKKYDSNHIKRINVFMGGADTNNITETIINICERYNRELKNKIQFDIVIGKANKHYSIIQKKIAELEHFNMYYNMNCLSELFEKADLCIGAPGATSYERCITQTPTICVCVAENQKTVLNKFIESNTIKYIGTIYDNYGVELLKYLQYFQENLNELKIMSQNCKQLVDMSKNQMKHIMA